MFEDLDVDMKSLYLRSNGLTSLPANIFAGLTGLKDLDLSCNRLTALDLARFDSVRLDPRVSGNQRQQLHGAAYRYGPQWPNSPMPI